MVVYKPSPEHDMTLVRWWMDLTNSGEIEVVFSQSVVSFVDFLSLARIDGTWKIVCKTFAHTGGKMPS